MSSNTIDRKTERSGNVVLWLPIELVQDQDRALGMRQPRESVVERGGETSLIQGTVRGSGVAERGMGLHRLIIERAEVDPFSEPVDAEISGSGAEKTLDGAIDGAKLARPDNPHQPKHRLLQNISSLFAVAKQQGAGSKHVLSVRGHDLLKGGSFAMEHAPQEVAGIGHRQFHLSRILYAKSVKT